jgi:transcriptional regulator EpsA
MNAHDEAVLDESLMLSAAQARALVRLLEAAPQVQRRYHFFVWLQTHVHSLLPHVLAVCGAYQRQRRELAFECFHSVSVPEPLLAQFSDGDSALMSALTAAWVQGRGQPWATPLDDEASALLQIDLAPLRAAGLGHLLAHGVARPQRPNEIETLFVLAGPETAVEPRRAGHLELLLPHLHATYLRVQGVEREMQQPPRAPAPTKGEPRQAQITSRERQVLQGVREGKSNQQISEVLGISALTVKNHVQKILRKLGAHNRAQAVAMTMSLGPGPAPALPRIREDQAGPAPNGSSGA